MSVVYAYQLTAPEPRTARDGYAPGVYPAGGFFSSIGSFFSGASKVLGTVAPIATLVNPALGMGLSSVSSVGGSLFGGGSSATSGGAPLKLGSSNLFGGFGGGASSTGTFVAGPGGSISKLPAESMKNIRTPSGHLVKGTGRRRRRMNPLNPRALRRAIHRERAFVHLAVAASDGALMHRPRHILRKPPKRRHHYRLPPAHRRGSRALAVAS